MMERDVWGVGVMDRVWRAETRARQMRRFDLCRYCGEDHGLSPCWFDRPRPQPPRVLRTDPIEAMEADEAWR